MKNTSAPLLQASQEGHGNVCTVLLEHNVNVNEKKEDGATPLFRAAKNGHVDITLCYLNTTQI